MLLLSAIKIFHGNYFDEFYTFRTVVDRWELLSFKMSILKYVLKLLVWTTNARSQPCLSVFAGIVFHT